MLGMVAQIKRRTKQQLREQLGRDQTIARAVQAALREAGAEQIFSDGAVTERKALARAIAELGPGDVLLVTRLDRLARSTRDLLNVLDAMPRQALASSRWPMLGPTPRLRTDD